MKPSEDAFERYLAKELGKAEKHLYPPVANGPPTGNSPLAAAVKVKVTGDPIQGHSDRQSLGFGCYRRKPHLWR